MKPRVLPRFKFYERKFSPRGKGSNPSRDGMLSIPRKETGRVVMDAIITRFVNDESGATAIEYGLIAAIVGIGIIVGLGALRDGLNNLFNNVKTQF